MALATFYKDVTHEQYPEAMRQYQDEMAAWRATKRLDPQPCHRRPMGRPPSVRTKTNAAGALTHSLKIDFPLAMLVAIESIRGDLSHAEVVVELVRTQLQWLLNKEVALMSARHKEILQPATRRRVHSGTFTLNGNHDRECALVSASHQMDVGARIFSM